MRLSWFPTAVRASVVGLFLAPAVLASAAQTGCGGGCRGTSLEPRTATFDDDGALVFEARLTSGGDPVEGAKVGFYSLGTSQRRDGTAGHVIGSAETDRDGVATLVREQGLEDMVVEEVGQELTGYQVSFSGLGKLDGVSYCETRENGTIEGI